MLGSAVALLAACGSRSPLSIDPRGEVTAVIDAGEEALVLPFCLTDSRLIGEIPIDLYFMMDRSLSMTTIDPGSTVSRWTAVSSAMNLLLKSPLSQGLGAGIDFFPRPSASGQPLCTAADYYFPVVPIGPINPGGGAAADIATAIATEMPMYMGTPTTPALDGAHKYARSEQSAHGDRIAAVVLVTDGVPRQCGSTVALTAALATEALAGTPPIKTYVLGVGPNLSNLDAIASAGGTSEAYLVESGGESALTAALETIRTSALTCEYVIPENTGQSPNLVSASVWTRTGADGGRVAVPQVAGAQACGDGPGWFYDHPIAAGQPAPSKITLCPASCDPVVHVGSSHLDVALGCDAAGTR
jgi:hypothetical protein